MAGKAKGRGRRQGRDEGSEVSDYRRKVRAGKRARGGNKGSCAPKLFMLLLPFAAAATFLFLKF